VVNDRRSDWVVRDVVDGGEETLVVFDGSSMKSALEDVAHPVVRRVEPSGIQGVAEPLPPAH
jgi:hypothetical protein